MSDWRRKDEAPVGFYLPSDGIPLAQRFLESIPRDAKICLLFHGDADGCSSGALLFHALKALGKQDIVATPPPRGENAYTPGTRRYLEEIGPDFLVVVDLGSSAKEILPGIPTLILDHHYPFGNPPGALTICAFEEQPTLSSSLLVFRTVQPYLSEDELWLVAIGSLGDLGPSKEYPEINEAYRRFGKTALTKAVSLVNAAKRASKNDVTAAFDALLEAKGPKDISQGRVSQYERLKVYQEEVKAESGRARKTRPRFREQVALLLFSSPCQIHALVAVAWRNMLRKFIVVAANTGYLPGKVNFSLRSALDIDLVQFLRGVDVESPEEDFGYGHRGATGGIVSRETFNKILERWGFPSLEEMEAGAE